MTIECQQDLSLADLKHANKVGLALGGGGVRGLAHIPILQWLDHHQIPIAQITGTSMGAIVGGLYATGMSGTEIITHVKDHVFESGTDLKTLYKKRHVIGHWVQALLPDFGDGGVFNAEAVFEHLFSQLVPCQFSELKIPFTAVATDYWLGEEVLLNQGKVLPAVKASMSVPGVFAPVKLNDKTLVDGGLVNNVPYEPLLDQCDLVIAVDVTNLPVVTEKKPGAIDVASGALDIMQHAALGLKLQIQRPQLLLRPKIDNVDMFDFGKIDKVMAAGKAVSDELDDFFA